MTLLWKGPKDLADRELAPTKDGQAKIDTKGCDFGKYNVTLEVTPSDANGKLSFRDELTINQPPQTQPSDPALEIRDGKPVLKVKVTPLADKDKNVYGAVSYRLRGPNDFSASADASDDGCLRFDLPDSVTPANYHTQLSEFQVDTVVRPGTAPAGNVPNVPPADPKQELLEILKQKQYITALPETPGDKAERLCDLPWSLNLDQFEIYLMTPAFQPGTSLSLGPKDTSTKTPRWPCNATISAATSDPKVLVGHFEVDTRLPWQRQLRFQPAGQKENEHDDAYAALRCCRLCLVIATQPVATCQLVEPPPLGPLEITVPVPSKPIATTLEGVGRVFGSLKHVSHPLLTRSGTKSEPIKHDKLELSLEMGKGDKPVVKVSDGACTATAVVKRTEGELKLEFKPTVDRALGIKAKRKHIDGRKDSIPPKQNDVIKLRRRLDVADRENNTQLKNALDADIKRLEEQIDKTNAEIRQEEKDLENLQVQDAFAEALQKATFRIPDWQIAWETEAQDKSPLPTGFPGGTVVIFIQGSPSGDPIVFHVPKKPAPNGEQTADASEASAE